MKQLFKKEDLIGKTIVDTFIPTESYQDLWLKFNDDSFIVFEIDDITEGFGYQKQIL